MRNLKIVTILTLIVIFILIGTNVVNADTGAKPSITIILENMNTTDYVLDLLVYDEDGSAYLSEMNCNDSGNPTDEQIEALYEINYDGWVSESTRWGYYLLMSDILGNEDYTHHFGYFGTPNEFKVVILFSDGTIKTSDVIERTEFDYEMYLDVNTMEIEQKYNFDFIGVLTCMVITVIIEVLIAVAMNINHTKPIILVNILTQLGIQSLRILNFSNYILALIIAELIVFIVEYAIYKKLFKDIDNKKIIIYTVIANFVTALLTFSNSIIISLILAALLILIILCRLLNSKKS